MMELNTVISIVDNQESKNAICIYSMTFSHTLRRHFSAGMSKCPFL